VSHQYCGVVFILQVDKLAGKTECLEINSKPNKLSKKKRNSEDKVHV